MSPGRCFLPAHSSSIPQSINKHHSLLTPRACPVGNASWDMHHGRSNQNQSPKHKGLFLPSSGLFPSASENQQSTLPVVLWDAPPGASAQEQEDGVALTENRNQEVSQSEALCDVQSGQMGNCPLPDVARSSTSDGSWPRGGQR